MHFAQRLHASVVRELPGPLDQMLQQGDGIARPLQSWCRECIGRAAVMRGEHENASVTQYAGHFGEDALPALAAHRVDDVIGPNTKSNEASEKSVRSRMSPRRTDSTGIAACMAATISGE